MWLALLFVWGSLLPLAASEGCPEASEDASSWVRLKPLGHCRDGENTCPYRITLPPLTIQLPKPFRELEKMARELQSLTQMVNQLKTDCRECKERQKTEWSLFRPGGEEDGERIQASKGSVNTKERQQDLPKMVKGITQTAEEETVPISSGTRQVNTTVMGKQRWVTSRETSLNPSSTRYRDETSGRPKGSSPTHMERKTDSMSKVRELHTLTAGERGKGLYSPRAKPIKSSLSGHQDEEQPLQASRGTVNTGEREQDLSKTLKVVHVSPVKAEVDPKLTSATTKQVNSTGIEKQKWNSNLERNPNQSKHMAEASEGSIQKDMKGSNPAHMERIIESMSKETNPFSTVENGKKLQSSKLGKPDDEQPRQSSGSSVITRERQQDIPKQVKMVHGTVQETEEEDTMLIRSGTKQVIPTDMEKQRWSIIQEWDHNQNGTGHEEVTSGGPKASNPEHMERRTDSTSKVIESHLFSTPENGKELQSPRSKLIESSLPINQYEEHPTQVSSSTVNTRERQQDIPMRVKVVQGPAEETEKEDIRSETKQFSPTDMKQQSWSVIQEKDPKQSSTGHKNVTSGGPKGTDSEHTERKTDSMSIVIEPDLFPVAESGEELQSPRAKQVESSLLRDHDEAQPTQGSSSSVNTRQRQQDILKRVKVVQDRTEEAEEEEIMVVRSRTKQVSPTGVEKQRWSTIREGNLRSRGTGNRDETSGRLKESYPAHTTESRSKVTEPELLSSRESGMEPPSPKDKQTESSLQGNQYEEKPASTSNTRETQEDVSKKVMVVQGITQKTEDDLRVLSSGTKGIHPAGIETQKWSQERKPNTRSKDVSSAIESHPAHMQKTTESISGVGEVHSLTKQTDETSGGPKESNPVHMDRKTEGMSAPRRSPSLTAEEKRKELLSSRAKQVEFSLTGNQGEEQSRHHENHKSITANALPGKNASTTHAQGKIKNNPNISVVTITSEDIVETRQMNTPNKDKQSKRFLERPRLIGRDRTEIKLEPNTEDRSENPAGIAKGYSHVGDGKVKSVPRRGGFTPISMRPNGRRPYKADSTEGTSGKIIRPDPYREDQNTSLTDIIRDTSRTLDSKKVFENTQPVTGTKAEKNGELVTEMTKTILDQQDEDNEEVSGGKKSRPFTFNKTGDSIATKEESANIKLYPSFENKDTKKIGNQSISHTQPKPFLQSTESNSGTEVDANSTDIAEKADGSGKSRSSISDTSNATFGVRIIDPQTQDRHSEKPLNPRSKAENDRGMDSSPVKPIGLISEPGKVKSSLSKEAHATTDLSNPNPQIQDGSSENLVNPRTHTESDSGMDSIPPNPVETVAGLEKSNLPVSVKTDDMVDASGTNPQRQHKNDDLSDDQPKPDLKTTRPNTEEIKAETQRKDMLSTNRTTSLRTGSIRPTTATDDKNPVRSASRPRMHAVGPNMRGRLSGLLPTRIQNAGPPHLKSTTEKEGAKELNQPNLRLVKNITSTPTRVIVPKNPKQRRINIWQRTPGNKSMETPLKVHSSGQVKNTSGVTEHMVNPSRGQGALSKTGPSSSSPKTEFESSADDMTQSVSPTVVTHTTVDQVSADKSQTAPTVEALNSLDNHPIQITPQNTKTKLFHVMEAESPRGKEGLDPITESVREHSAETVRNQNIVSHDSNHKSDPHSHQAFVENTKSTGSSRETSTSTARKQENYMKSLGAGGVHSSTGKILPTVVSTVRNELNNPTTTATTYTPKTVIMDQQSPMTQSTTSAVTTPHFIGRDHLGKARTTSRVKVSDTHIRHRIRNSSQEVESKRLTGTRSDSESRNKKQDLILKSSSKVQRVSSTVTTSYPNSVRNPKPVVTDTVKSTAGPKASTPSTYSTPHTYHEDSRSPVITVASVEGNNGNSYPVAVDRAKKRTEVSLHKITAERASEENSQRPLINIMEDRDGLENQLLSTCHGQCDPEPTLQPILDIRRPSENSREIPPQDCSDLLKKKLKNGVYSVTPAGSKNSTFRVFCDMEASGGGWTLIQNRFDGSISFNRSWDDYKKGFGNLTGEFWLGNDKIHWLTSAKAMVLRIELEDLDGVKEYAQYDRFHVSNEKQRYRLTIGEYSGTAGNALQFSKKFNHDQKDFSTPDRDNDQYPSGNCGAYYSSGWWFDACMAANLNGKYYQTRYRGVRNGIFWGTWHNISTEYYPTNDRQAFKTVRMMVRPRVATGRDY